FYFSLTCSPPTSPPFPYTTLFRSCVLVICHEIPIRYALNTAGDSDNLDGPVHTIPNATPFLFDEGALSKAADEIERLASGESETDRKSTRLNSSHEWISYAVFCLK